MQREGYFSPRFGQSAGQWGNQSHWGQGTVFETTMKVGKGAKFGNASGFNLDVGDTPKVTPGADLRKIWHTNLQAGQDAYAERQQRAQQPATQPAFLGAFTDRINAWRNRSQADTSLAPVSPAVQPQVDRNTAWNNAASQMMQRARRGWTQQPATGQMTLPF